MNLNKIISVGNHKNYQPEEYYLFGLFILLIGGSPLYKKRFLKLLYLNIYITIKVLKH